mmetsp:Transcript_490/g.1015  ORF Transcript_490/g.1015 Transcript_490/m.1015 type:complete len:335 (+) Transcript_490:659-1663(+)
MVSSVYTGVTAGEAVEVVPRVELYARLVGAHRHPAAAPWLEDTCDRLEAVGAHLPRQHVVVVVAHAIVRLCDARPDGHSPSEIHRIRNLADFSSWDGDVIHGRVKVRCQLDLVVQDACTPTVTQVPVRVVCQVHRGRRICGCRVLDAQLVGRRQRIGDTRDAVAWIALVSRLGEQSESERRLRLCLAVPHLFVPTNQPAMKVVWAVVSGNLVALPIETECGIGCPICDSANGTAKVRTGPIIIRLHLIKAKRHLLHNTTLVWHAYRVYNRAEVENLDCQRTIPQRALNDGLSASGGAHDSVSSGSRLHGRSAALRAVGDERSTRAYKRDSSQHR